MIYTVGWLSSAEAELARIYNEAGADKRAVSASCNRIDQDLRTKAEHMGVPHDYGRVYSDPPLCVHFQVDPGDRKVTGPPGGAAMKRKRMATRRYSMLIQWSDEDQVFVVTLPEFGGCITHGDSYEEAARQGQDALESLIESYQAEGRPLPAPQLFTFPAPEETPGASLERSVG